MISALSKLGAVNTMLAVCGESPINSLEGSQSVDTALAESVLDEVSRDIQSKGWHFNTEHSVTLGPDTDGFIALSDSMLRVDLEAQNQGSLDIVVRGDEGINKLYDRRNHTFIFGHAVIATVIYGLEYEDMPQSAKQYIMIRSARVLQDRLVGSVKHHQFTVMDEMHAYNNLMEYEGWTADHTIFDNMDTFHVIRRGSQIDRVS